MARLIVQLTEAEYAAHLDRRLEPIEALLARLCTATATAVLDRRGLARALSCSVKTLDRLRAQPGFPELLVLDSPRFELAAVLTYLRARGTSSGFKLVRGGK